MQPINWPRRRRLSFIMNFLHTPRSRSEPTDTEPWHQFTGRGTENFSSIENLFFPILRAEIWHPLIGHRTADLSSVEILFLLHLSAVWSRDIAPIHRPLHRAFFLPWNPFVVPLKAEL